MTERRRPTVLLLGAAGQLGTELRAALGGAGRLVALTRAELDLSDLARVRETVRAVSPSAVVNAAAFTNVDLAESEPALAFRVNATAPGVLAEEAARAGALLVHFSTDYVFDGNSRVPYRESDPPNPLGAYAESKFAGEQAVAGAGGSHLILRVSWVYGAHGNNFARWLLRAARLRHELSMVHDQTGVPTWGTRIAEGTTALLARLQSDDEFTLPGHLSGVYHLVSQGETSRLDFAQTILAEDPRRDEQVLERLIPIASTEFPSPARRPMYSALDSTLLESRFGVRIPEWRGDLTVAMTRGITPLPASHVR